MKQIYQEHLTFVKLDRAPARCRIQKERNRIQEEKKSCNAGNATFIRWDVEKFINEEFKRMTPIPKIYSVSLYDLEQKIKLKKIGNLISCVTPALTKVSYDYRDRVEFFKKNNIQVNCSAYYDMGHLFLLDDVVKWGYRWLEWDEVRTAEDIILAMRKDKELLESKTFKPEPGSLWLVVVEGRNNVVRVSISGDGFYIPGQDPCWDFSHVDRWLEDVTPKEK